MKAQTPPLRPGAPVQLVCGTCRRPIHAIDGAIAKGSNEPFVHQDCAAAARIDYAAAFDQLYKVVLEVLPTIPSDCEAKERLSYVTRWDVLRGDR